MSRVAPALVAGALIFGFAACGGDDDDDAGGDTTATTGATTETSGATETTAATEGTEGGAAGEASVEAFCEAELAVEAAVQSEDPSAAAPAFEALVAASPEEIRATVEDLIANAESGPGDQAFDEPYGEMIQYMRDNCGFNEIEVTTADYSFTGLPTEIGAGPAIVSMDNTGEEFHEVAFYRVNDDVTESLGELLALPEEEVETKVTRKGGAFGPPGATSFGTVNLDEAGRYVVICALPQGMTPEAVEQFEAAEGTTPEGSAPEGTEPEGSAPGDSPFGPPHFTLGMVQELTVT